MNPLPSRIPTQHYTDSTNAVPSLASSSQAQHPHPLAISLASLSPNAHRALDQTEAQLNGHHKLMALLARNGIADGALHLSSTQGPDAHYQQQLNVPESDIAHLTVRVRLNEQSQYDIAGIDLHVPSSDRTQSMVFSQDDSAGASTGVPGPSRNRPAHAARSAPYKAPSLSSRSGATSKGKPPKRPSATLEQINAHLHNDDGSLRTKKDVASALHVSGFGARNVRIATQTHAAGGARRSATVEQINAHLHNDDGSLRTMKDAASALHAAELGARYARIGDQLRAARGPQ